MIVNSTDLKNNLGKYLRDCIKEEIIITGNGRKIARLNSYSEDTGDKIKTEYADRISEGSEAFKYGPKKVTYEEFLKLTEGNEKRYEYIDGKVYLLTSPKTAHQKVLGELYIFFYNWFKDKKCIPMLPPYDITLKRNPDNINVVEPDLVVICDMEENLNEKDYYMGVPSLVLEILSKSTRRNDAVKKLDLYMSTGVKEYWLVNPESREVTVYLFENNDIARNETYKKDEEAMSYIFEEFRIGLKDIFQISAREIYG